MWHLKFNTTRGVILMRVSPKFTGTPQMIYVLEIEVPRSMKGTGMVNGFCGNNDGNPTNDSR